MANTTTEELYAYLTAQYRIFRPGERTSGKLEELTITGTERKHWDQLLTEFDASVAEFRGVKSKAGRRLANKLIYLK